MKSTSTQHPMFKGKLPTLSDDELIALRAALEVEMRKRGIAFSVGDIGEKGAIEHFRKTPGLPNLQAAPTGTKNVDALSRNGDRYSIKTIWKGKKTGTIYPDPDSPNRQLFEYLLVVRLGKEMTVESIHEFTWLEFLGARCWDKRMSAWYVPISVKSMTKSTRIV